MPIPEQALAQGPEPTGFLSHNDPIDQALSERPASSIPSAPPGDEGTLSVLRQGQMPVSCEAMEASLGQWCFISQSRAGNVKDVIYMDEPRSFF